jgi:hypothetical protein
MADFNYRSPLAASVANPRRMNRIAASAAARRACRSVDPNRHDNLKLLFVAPPAPTFPAQESRHASYTSLKTRR